MNDTILSRFTWDFPGGVTGLVLAAALGITLIVLSYAFTRTSLSPFRRMLFLILRLTAFAALLYCLCNPRMETRRSVSQTHSRKIAVLLDESGSMQKQNYWKRSRLQDAIRFLEENGIRVLENKAVTFERDGKRLHLAGLAESRPQTHLRFVKRMPEEPLIVMMHYPDNYLKIVSDSILLVAGHTHGGQVKLPLLGRPGIPSRHGQRFAYGLIEEVPGKKMIVTSGIGTSMLRVRFSCPPEVVVLTLAK